MLILTSTIKASIQCAGVKDVRHILNGAMFKLSGKTLHVVSTDGRMLSKFAHEYPEIGGTGGDFEIIIPLDTLKTAAKSAGKLPALELACVDATHWTLGALAFTPIDGRYPDYERVIVLDRIIGAPGQFDADLLIRARAALRTFDNAPKAEYFLQHKGTYAAIMRNDGDAVVVIMPSRVNSTMRGMCGQ
jgi:hypothetical protein